MRLLLAGIFSACFILNAAAQSFPECRPGAKSQRVDFLHVTDLHAHYYPYVEGFSPYARILGYFDELKKTNPYTLLTDGGDQYEKGSLSEQLSQGQTTLEVSRLMPFDVRALGNHDFAWNLDQLLEFSRQPSSLVLSGNLSYKGKNKKMWGAQEYGELQVGCLKIGFFSLVEKPWNADNEPYDGRFYPPVLGRYDYAQRAREIVLKHRDSVQLLVLISHLGLEWDRQVAAAVPGIDLILGGHTHDVLWESQKIGGAQVVNGGYNADYMARVEMTYDLKRSTLAAFRHEIIPNNSERPARAQTQTEIEGVLSPYLARLTERAAILHSAIDRPAITLLAAKAAAAVLKADVALTDSDMIWQQWNSRELNLQDLFNALPVEREPPGTSGFSSFYVTTVSGKDILDIQDAMDPARYAFYGPEKIFKKSLYKLALPKRVALNPRRWISEGVSLGKPVQALEAWEVLREYARKRSRACLYFDVDEKIEDCQRP